MKSFKPRHAFFVASVAAVLGSLAFACGSGDGAAPGACEGPTCDAGPSDEASRADGQPSEDASRPGDASDGGSDAGLDADAAQPPYTGTHIWSKRFGDTPSGGVSGPGLATDSAGNVFVAGTLTGSANFGGGVLTGAGGGDVYVAKFTKDGQHIWSKRFGDADTQGAGNLAVDAAGNVYFGGGFNGTINFGGGLLTSAGGYDAYVAKLDASGNHVWSKSFGDAAYQILNGLTLVGSDVVLIGENDGSADFGGGPLTGSTGGINYLVRLGGSNGAHVWSKQPTSGGFIPRGLTADKAGNIIGAGQLVNGFPLNWGGGTLTSAGGDDVLAIKFDSGGNTIWSKRFGDSSFQHADTVAANPAGDIFLAGRISGTLDFGVGPMTVASGGAAFLARLDKNGGGVWNKFFSVPVAHDVVSPQIAVDVFGNVAIAATTTTTLDFGGGALPATDARNNPVIGKFDGTGKHLWSKGWAIGSGAGGSGGGAQGVAFDMLGNMLFVTGLYQGTVDLGGGPLTSIGGDLVLAKFSP